MGGEAGTGAWLYNGTLTPSVGSKQIEQWVCALGYGQAGQEDFLLEALVDKLNVEHHEPERGEVQAVLARLLEPASEHKTEVVSKGLA